MKNIIYIVVLVLLVANSSFSQEVNDALNDNDGIKIEMKQSSLAINGTSTLHDWVSNTEKVDAFIVINNFNEFEIEELNLVVKVDNIKNDKGSSLMDKLTRKALKEPEFPEITYVFLNAETIENNENRLKVKLIGNLTIAGKTNKIEVLTTISKSPNNVILIGSHQLKMTDYDVDPPKALFGTIQTADDITIEFSIKF